MKGLLVLLLGIVGSISAQRLLFKSNKELEQARLRLQHQQVSVQGFGFKEPRQYYTGPRKSQQVIQELQEDAVECPDKKSACPQGSTCCMVSIQAYGCCPMLNATCCVDRQHCCPMGSKCDVAKKVCYRGEMETPWFEKQPAIMLDNTQKQDTTEVVSLGTEGDLGSVMCPDGEHECQNGQTCCKTGDGYACCPIPDAACCADGVHCCPKGYTCDLSHSRCTKTSANNSITGLFRKTPAINRQSLTSTVEGVKCDDKHECPTGNTCCKIGDAFACCPKPNAVCCKDNQHCCPHDTECNMQSGSCKPKLSYSQLLPTVIAISNQRVSLIQPITDFVTSVECDDRHECPSGNTCCKLSSGQWGCCPLPQAVCCSDGVHCCPSGTTCDVSSGKCNRGLTQVDWFEKTAAQAVRKVKCDSTHECPSGNTCCKLSGGQWGCCPLPKAVCCSDGVHCCPSGTSCDVSSGKCNRGLTQVDWFEKTAALAVKKVKCDSTHECPSGNTCCKLSGGQWGCCPLPQAVCCSDGVHCCPSGTTCDVSSGKCNKGLTQVDWFEKTAALDVGKVKCDSTHECPSGNTCCKLSGGQWGCCPLPQAVCCSDGVHCCPSGTTCDVSSGKCNRGLTQVDWFEKTAALDVGKVKCDSTHECPSSNTCCKLSGGQWGCCPLPKAVCCSDGVHCCPSETTCDVSSGKCNKGLTQVDWFEKTASLDVGKVKCDSTHECPSSNTCCKLSGGQWGCCPLPKAVCCSDGVHCCPSGTTCDVSSGKCNKGLTQVDWFEKTAALDVGKVKCDSTHECPSSNTCCKLSGGQWGCCPLPQAVCCSDGVHCCPSGTTCDVSSGKCNKGLTQVDWFEKTAALAVKKVKCDSTHECPSGNTCCKLSGGQWGCCPLPQAVCCSDGVHCCPSGTTCDVSSGKCNKGLTKVDWFEKTAALDVGKVKCDSTHECPSSNTCCKLSGGQWGCCPLPQAVCCSDGVHCCPSGTTCDVSSGKCNKGLTQVDWFEKTAALDVGKVKCDSTHECPSGNTCCKLSGGQWGCCPLPQAVCCSDGVHCCPSGTTCDVGSGKCNRGLTQVDWFEKTAALAVGKVKCDSTHECPSGNTCCKLSGGQWGCCPLPKAVCCSDGVHCCPSGTTCDVGSGKCNRGLTQVDWFEKTAALAVGKVKCDSTHECPSSNTCCKLSDGQWGCCPLPQAVCCSDGVHCCPSGTTCDVGSGKCNRGLIQVDWFMKQPALGVGSVTCDSSHACPDGNTCCKLASGQWGCCPRPDAVCCSDHVHCCPSGYTCASGEGKCNPGNTHLQVDWSSTHPAISTGALDWFVSKTGETTVGSKSTVDCPGGKTYCNEGSTCCKLSTGDYGCCPLPNANCCSDEVHCCPGGWTCVSSTGQCQQGTVSMPWQVKTPALKKDLPAGLMVICPDGSECKDEETCCMMDHLAGSYGCCPLPNAVCCSDNQHCCPSGYKCNLKASACTRGKLRHPLIQTVSKSSVKEEKVIEPVKVERTLEPVQEAPAPVGDANVDCPGGVTCDSNAKCCDNGKGGSFCCEYPKGVCCVDKKHCCPPGYICDQGADICRIPETSYGASTFLRKLQAKPIA